MIDLLVLLANVAVFICIPLAALRSRSTAIGLFICALPVLNLSRRLFEEYNQLFPSLETLAAFLAILSILVFSRGQRSRGIDGVYRVIIPMVFATSLLSVFASTNITLSLRMLIAGVVIPLLWFVIVIKSCREPKDWEQITRALLLMVVTVGLHTLANFDKRQDITDIDEDFWRTTYSELPLVSTFVVPSTTVAALMPGIPLAAWYLRSGLRWNKLLFVAAMFACLSTAVLSLSRGSWLGTALCLIGSLPMLFRRVTIQAASLGSCLLLVVHFLGGFDILFETIEFRTAGSVGMESVDVRQANYLLALRSAPDHLAMGFGLGHYPLIYKEHPEDRAARLHPLIFAHSLFLTLIPEISLIGAISLLLVFILPVWSAYKARAAISNSPVDGLRYALSVTVFSFVVIASTSGMHVVSYFRPDPDSTCFTSPALIVMMTCLGMLVGIRNWALNTTGQAQKRMRPTTSQLQSAHSGDLR